MLRRCLNRTNFAFRKSTAASLALTGLSWRPTLRARKVSSVEHPAGKLVVLGSGWAGYKLLQSVDTHAYECALISPRNHFILTPMLAGSAVGTLDFRSISEPVRNLTCKSWLHPFPREVQVYQACCTEIDLKKRIVHCQSSLEDNRGDKFAIDFDHLVIAVGARSNTFGIKGVEEHTMFLKDTTDARRIRQRIIECFEHAQQPNVSISHQRDLLHFVICGGGPTGVEFAAELHDFITQDLNRLYPDLKHHVRITIVEAGQHILSTFDEQLREYAEARFRKGGIQVRHGVRVTSVEHRKMTMSDADELRFGMAVWSTGVAPLPLVQQLQVEKDRRGRIITDGHFRVPGQENVYAIGDCAVIKDRDLPQTAQVANQQGKYLAQLLNTKQRDNSEPPAFDFRPRGMMAYLGHYVALVDLPKHEVRGVAAWLAWRAFYLTTTVSWRNTLLVPINWMITFLFGRDTSRF